ncbi:MAG: Sir2 family NAD-dependent protein deacetylase, partial [Chitinophagaceae bacterium]
VAAANPNAAHYALAELEKEYKVIIVTQNIDDLHERAGSSDVIHLHGEIFKMRSEALTGVNYPIMGDINLGDLAPDGAQLRPDIVWFDEPVPMIQHAANIMTVADIFLLIGTSLQVYPAAGLINFVPIDVPKYIIDRKIPGFMPVPNIHLIEKPATEGMEELVKLLNSKM